MCSQQLHKENIIYKLVDLFIFNFQFEVIQTVIQHIPLQFLVFIVSLFISSVGCNK